MVSDNKTLTCWGHLAPLVLDIFFILCSVLFMYGNSTSVWNQNRQSRRYRFKLRGVNLLIFAKYPWFNGNSQNWGVQFWSSSKIKGRNCTPCTPLTWALIKIGAWHQLQNLGRYIGTRFNEAPLCEDQGGVWTKTSSLWMKVLPCESQWKNWRACLLCQPKCC